LTTRAKFLSRDTSLGSDQEDTAASSPTEAEGIYGTKRYGTVHSPMTEWHGSFPFLSLISARRAREMRRVLCAHIRVHTLARMRQDAQRLQVPCTPAGTYPSVRNRRGVSSQAVVVGRCIY